MAEVKGAVERTVAPGEPVETEDLHGLLAEYKRATADLVASHDTLRAQLAEVRRELAAKNR
ncbi:MAG: hypothetical protein ACE5GW_11075, partial [Planctomycetota bacterium]